MVDTSTDVTGEYFWDIKWSDAPICDTGYFITQDEFEKHSVVHKKSLLNLFGTSYDEVIEDTKNKFSKNMPQNVEIRAAEKCSSLSAVEQRLYLHLFQKYSERICSNPTTEEKNEIQKLGELHAKVVLEQGEVIQHLKEISTNQLYNYIHPEALRYIQLLLKEKLDRCLTYPRHYKQDDVIGLLVSEENNDISSELLHQRHILELGKIPRQVHFSLEKPCVLPLDSMKICKRFPVTRLSTDDHPSKKFISEDTIAKSLALKYGVDMVLSSSSLKTLLDNHAADFEKEWELPLCVQECTDESGSKKIVFIDKALARSRMSGRERNSLYYKYAVKAHLTHFNPSRIKTSRFSDAGKTKSDSRSERSLQVVETDLFGDSDVTDFDTFGDHVNCSLKNDSSIPVESCDSVTNVEESATKIILESPASPDAEPVDSLPSIQMKVVNVNSSFDTSSDCENIFKKPQPRTETNVDVIHTDDSDSETLVIDLNTSTPSKPIHEDGANEDVFQKPQPSVSTEATEKRLRTRANLSLDSDSDGLVIDLNNSALSDRGVLDATSQELKDDVTSCNVESKVEESSVKEGDDGNIDDHNYSNKRSDSDNVPVSPGDEELNAKNKAAQKDVISGVRRSPRNRRDKVIEESQTSMVLRSRKKVGKVVRELTPILSPDKDAEGFQNVENNSVQDSSAEVQKDGLTSRSQNNLSTSENPLDSILQLQKVLLHSENLTEVTSKFDDKSIQPEKSSLYPIPNPKDNVVYSLLSLRKLKLLIRHKLDCVQMPSGQVVSMIPKVEYHPEYGAELSSKSDLIRQWVNLILNPDSQIVKARINAQTAHVLMTENLNMKNLLDKNVTRFQPSVLVRQLANVLESLQKLSTGQYILCHKRSESNIQLYKTTENNKRGTFDLHILLQQRQVEVSDGLKAHNGVSCWLSLDTEVFLPSLVKHGRIPATYPPRVVSGFRNDKKRTNEVQQKKRKRKRSKKLSGK